MCRESETGTACTFFRKMMEMAADTPIVLSAPELACRFIVVTPHGPVFLRDTSMSKPQQSSTKQQQQTKLVDWQKMRSAAGPYPIEAFEFVREGLGYTANHIHPDRESLSEADRHISGQQLCMGLRD